MLFNQYMSDSKMPESIVERTALMVPSRSNPEKRVSLELMIKGLGHPVGQIFLKHGQEERPTLYLPQPADIGEQVMAMQEELKFKDLLLQVSDELDEMSDAGNLSAEEKVREGLAYIAAKIGAPYAMIQLSEPTGEVPQIIEVARKNGGYAPLREIKP